MQVIDCCALGIGWLTWLLAISAAGAWLGLARLGASSEAEPGPRGPHSFEDVLCKSSCGAWCLGHCIETLPLVTPDLPLPPHLNKKGGPLSPHRYAFYMLFGLSNICICPSTVDVGDNPANTPHDG